MNLERDKFLSEAMGECWHEPYFDMEESTWVGEAEMKWNNNFSAWEGYSKLWEWSKKQDWFYELIILFDIDTESYGLDTSMITPDHFADVVYNYLKE